MLTTLAKKGQFGKDEFLVQTRKGKDVPAKWLDDGAGNYIIDPWTSEPYMVPMEYDVKSVVSKYAAIRDGINGGSKGAINYENPEISIQLKGADLFLGLNLISENKSVPFVVFLVVVSPRDL
ncbi:hypothetical protein ACIPIN_12845 [Pseudomonas sp. NPDC087697]|uniref:hypothetical protein n=1 Tax=Pseudomonas sp. NPDC087697 TaxID=3364447 RepID=UPI00382C3C19